MFKTKVLITALGNGGVGAQILKALKSTNLDIEIIGGDILSECANSKGISYFYQLPRPENKKEYAYAIDQIITKHGVEVIFVGSEQELLYFNDQREIYEEKGIVLAINSKEIIQLCLNKYNLFRKLDSLNIPVVKFWKINSISDCKKIKVYPVVLKPNTGSGASANVYIAFDRPDAMFFSRYMMKLGIDIVAQEYFGEPEQEYTIGVSSNEDGIVLGNIILKRVINSTISTKLNVVHNGKKYVISSGASQGDIIHDDNISMQAKEIAEMLKSKGPLNIQCRVVNGILYVFEINPRLSGSTAMRACAGYNEPENIIKEKILRQPGKYSYKNIKVRKQLEDKLIS